MCANCFVGSDTLPHIVLVVEYPNRRKTDVDFIVDTGSPTLRKKIIVLCALLLFFTVNSEFLTHVSAAASNEASSQGLLRPTADSLSIPSSKCADHPEFGLSNCLWAASLLKQVRIAVVNPVFTTAAYSSFYHFYIRYDLVQEGVSIRRDTSLLNAPVNKNGWGRSDGLYYFVESKIARDAGIVVGNNTSIITDVDVNDGKLFYSNGTKRFDVVILGFTEYVTASEYSNYKRFVEKGGRLIFLSACNFLAEVSYNATTNEVRLVSGHGWEFNGRTAHKGPYHRWYAENTNWVGSNYALFYSNGYQINGAIATDHPLGVLLKEIFEKDHFFSSYVAHEEIVITNSSDRPIALWEVSPPKGNWIVAAYEHDYQSGMVIHTGIFGTDIIATDAELQFFLLASIGYLPSVQLRITPQTSSILSQSIHSKHIATFSRSETKVKVEVTYKLQTITTEAKANVETQADEKIVPVRRAVMTILNSQGLEFHV
ncbi:MAG: N,N-dimethylformamidase beta subunit family domain-containing protein [Candidatus Bathyarchaeia archaeon]